MKITTKAPVEIRGKSREATAIEQSINNLLNKYGLELVRYVTNKIISKEVAKKKLEKDIAKKERELESLKRQR